MSVGFTGPQDATFPSFFPLMIGAVGKNLGLQAQTGPERIYFSRLTAETPVQVVAGIKLDARLIGINLHDPTGTRIAQVAA